MICFEFIIFALSITALVILFILDLSCDLLRIYYFCTINHSNVSVRSNLSSVVICFEFIIFALSITACCRGTYVREALWFASNLLFLHYQSQRFGRAPCFGCRCDLLRIYYFCTINHSSTNNRQSFWTVVICFEFIIFALSITAQSGCEIVLVPLWFASNLLFLHYQSQPIVKLS